ncbi:MAG: sigma 54-interacting transcriptional regulator [Bacillota bacterium]
MQNKEKYHLDEISLFDKNDTLFNDWLNNCISEAIMIIDKETRILYVNSQYAKITGYNLEKVRGKRLCEIEPSAFLNRVVQTGQPVIGQHYKIKSARGINVVTFALPIFYNQKIIGGIGIFRDVSQMEQIMNDMLKMKALLEYYQEELNLKSSLHTAFASLIGENREFIKALIKAHKAAKSNATVLIEGESGVGKNLLAKAIHISSDRKDKPFIEVNCAAIPETLLESELFGYVGGAFTGARREGKVGKIELANGGTLFLDEIGDMSISMQSKILTVIQERVIERIGDSKKIPLDIRIITATNKNLRSLINSGKFREDLYFRLNVIPIFLPPLRRRKEDIPLLIDYFIKKYNQKYNKNVNLCKNTLKILNSYDWPGNIRELNNVIEHAVLMCTGGLIQPEHLPEPFNQKFFKYLSFLGNSTKDFPKLKTLLEEVEKEAITTALKLANQNRTKAMEMLGLSRRMFYHKIKKYGLNLNLTEPSQ